MMMLQSAFDSLPGWSGEVLVATLACFVLSRFLYSTKRDVPFCPGALPLIGHALAYKEDPATFLSSQKLPVFRINLAGCEMIVVNNDERAMQQVTNMPESKMSARQAVSDIGFEYTLGKTNVYIGTDIHKRILKDYVYNKKNDDVMVTIFKFLEKAVTVETDDVAATNDNDDDTIVAVDDLFVFVRRTMLRAMLMYVIAPSILNGDNQKFLDAFMSFQDAVEDATAKAAVLPRIVSIPFILRPVAQQRDILTKQLASMIETVRNDSDAQLGPWLVALKQEDYSPIKAAELTLGLMFAAHKNPAIGVSQCFCYLQTNTTRKQYEDACKEARSMYKSNSQGKNPTTSRRTLKRCVLETLRLTAHSIGGIRTVQTPFILETSSGETFSIRKGDVIALCHISTHRDSSVWGSDAQLYNQDRWEPLLDDDNTTTTTGVPVNEYKFTTFSQGIHKCPGEQFALNMMEMTLALLLVRNAKLVDSNENVAKISFERATLAQRDGNVPITISRETLGMK